LTSLHLGLLPKDSPTAKTNLKPRSAATVGSDFNHLQYISSAQQDLDNTTSLLGKHLAPQSESAAVSRRSSVTPSAAVKRLIAGKAGSQCPSEGLGTALTKAHRQVSLSR
jgi:hypothetical protein